MWDYTVKSFASFLKAIAIEDESIWYLSPEQHASELIIFNIIMVVILVFALRKGREVNASNNASGKSITKPNAGSKYEKQELSFILQVYRIILLLCFLATVVHKVNGEKISNMLMPCHVATAFYLYCLFTPNKQAAEHVFNISVHYMFFTWLAIAMPDLRGLKQFGEIFNFWVHHWILCFIPLHVIITGHYKLDRTNNYYFKIAAVVGLFVHFNMMSIAGLISGHNVGYMLAPPTKTPLGENLWFRWSHSAFMVIMGWICAYIIPPILIKFGGWLGLNDLHKQHNGKNAHNAVSTKDQTANGKNKARKVD